MAISEAELLVILAGRMSPCEVNENAYIVHHARAPQGKGKWSFEYEGRYATVAGVYDYAKRAAVMAFGDDTDPVKVRLLPKPVVNHINPQALRIPVDRLV